MVSWPHGESQAEAGGRGAVGVAKRPASEQNPIAQPDTSCQIEFRLIHFTLVAGLRHDRIVAPFVIDGAMNGSTFLTYVERCLVSTLDRRDIVIIDNLPAHKVVGVTDAIEAVGATVVYLPPYSPDLNPIEQLFSKLKALLRKAAERTIPRLWRKIRSLLRTVSAEECLNFLRHAGYAST